MTLLIVCAKCRLRAVPVDRSVCEKCFPLRGLTALGPPAPNEVWGNPRDASTWRMIQYVNDTSIQYYVFGIPYHAHEPISDWNQWFIENAPHNITEFAKDAIESNEEPVCPCCNGCGSVDTGGTDECGQAYPVACPECNGTGKLTDEQAEQDYSEQMHRANDPGMDHHKSKPRKPMHESLYRPRPGGYCVGQANDPQPEDKLKFYTLPEAIEKAKDMAACDWKRPVAIWNETDAIVHLFLCGQIFAEAANA